jgi:hypothetical protein
MISTLFAALLLMTDACSPNTLPLSVGGTGADVSIVYPFLLSGSPEGRFDVVFVGDGFTSAPEDVDRFEDFVDRAIKALSTPPYRKCAFNFYWVRLVSNEAGADHASPDDPIFEADPALTVPYCVDTPLNMQFGAPEKGEEYADPRYLYTVTPERCEEAAELATVFYDLIVVIVNDDTYGGAAWPEDSGIPILAVSACAEFEHVLLHEMGHRIAHLGDEYDNQVGWTGCYDAGAWGEPDYPNVTAEKDPLKLKWKVDAGVPVPTDSAGIRVALPGKTWDDLERMVGLWKGANEYDCGIYRPSYTCRMRDVVPFFCPVCEDTIAKATKKACPTLEAIRIGWEPSPPLACILGSTVRIPLPPCLKCLLTARSISMDDFAFSGPKAVRVEIGPLPGVEMVRVLRFPEEPVTEAGPLPGSGFGRIGPVFVLEFEAEPHELYFLEFSPRRCDATELEFDLRLWINGVQVI